MLPKVYKNNIPYTLKQQEDEMHFVDNAIISNNSTPEILFLTTYPPTAGVIATYSQNLVKALTIKFKQSFSITVCALETKTQNHNYLHNIKYLLNTDIAGSFLNMVKIINENNAIEIIVIEHEFSWFQKNEEEFLEFLNLVTKPVILSFHTIVPLPYPALKQSIKGVSKFAEYIIVTTNASATILATVYDVPLEKITVIAHSTYLVPALNKKFLKSKYNLTGKKVLSTFGLLSPERNIETIINALPAIVKRNPEVIFLIIGKTHPLVFKTEGENYRTRLELKVQQLELQVHVKFINEFLPLPNLLEYLQLTDIYLFTTKDYNQPVSGTFAYAISCGCPVISTPTTHALQVLKKDKGVIVDFNNTNQLATAVNNLLKSKLFKRNIHLKNWQSTENVALPHNILIKKAAQNQLIHG